MPLLILTMLISCKTKYVAVPEYHMRNKSLSDSLIRRDSIWVIDSVTLFSRADTVFKEKYRTIYKDRWLERSHTDTIMMVDSIRVPYPVEKTLSRVDKIRMKLGSLTGILIVILIPVGIMRLLNKIQFFFSCKTFLSPHL